MPSTRIRHLATSFVSIALLGCHLSGAGEKSVDPVTGEPGHGDTTSDAGSHTDDGPDGGGQDPGLQDGGSAGDGDHGAGDLDAGGGHVDASLDDRDSAVGDDDSDAGAASSWPGDDDLEPVGDDFDEIFPDSKLDQPPGETRYTLNDGEYHFWLFADDESTYPGQDSGPRSEVRLRNDYDSGQAQFQADVKIDSNCHHASVMQIFGGDGHATAFMVWAMPDALSYYNSKVIETPIYDRWFRLNVIHDTDAGTVEVYVDRELRGTFEDHGPATHYFKFGLYHQQGMSERCDDYFKNVRIFAR